jgi:hypothetical protein
MRSILILILILALAPLMAGAANEKTVTRTSPMTSFSTTKSADEFTLCVLRALHPDYPRSAATASGRGKEITVVDGTRTSAVIWVGKKDEGNGALIMMHAESQGQIERDPAVKLAKNCR